MKKQYVKNMSTRFQISKKKKKKIKSITQKKKIGPCKMNY